MCALSADRNTPERDSQLFEGPVAASKLCYVGALLVRDSSGNIEPGTTATGKIPVGRCEEQADNSSGAAAAINVKYRMGCFRWANSSGDPVTKANIGDNVYIEDDQTVCATGTSKSPAGVTVDIDSLGVWVSIGPNVFGSTGLLAANNLSDVATAATAATNLGLGTASAVTHASLTTTGAISAGTTLAATTNATVGGTLGVTGVSTLTGLLNANGGIAVDTNKFTVSAAGAVVIASTLAVTGAQTMTGLLNANGGIAVDTNKFTCSAAGAVAIASTLTVAGAATFSSLVNLDGGLAMDTNKFTVANGTGNTLIAGTLGVTGATTLTAAVTPTGGVAASGGMSAYPGGVCHTGGLPARVSTDGTNAAYVNTEYYVAEVFVPCNMSITGISLFNGATVGTDSVHAALAYSDGTIVVGSATGAVATAGADAYQNIPFSGGAITVVGPATYFVAIIPSGATDKYNAHPLGNFRAGKITGRTYGAITSFTPPSTFTADLGPIASLY